MKRKPKVSLAFKRLSVADKISFGGNVHSEMSKNSSVFTDPDISMDDLSACVEDLSKANDEAQSGDHNKIAVLHEKEKAFDTTFTTEASYVDRKANGLESTILLSGFKATTSETKKTQPCEAPENVQAEANAKVLGAAVASCDVVEDADAYVYCFSTSATPIVVTNGFISKENNPDLVGMAIDTHNKLAVTGLPSRSTLYITIFGVNRTGFGAGNTPVAFRTI